MNLKALAVCAAILVVPATAIAGGYTNGNSPSSEWNAHWNFDSAGAKQQKLNEAIAIEQQSKGAYRAPNYYTTNTTNVGHIDNGAYVTNNIGSITQIEAAVTGDGSSISTDASSTNNGEVTGNIATSVSGVASNETTSGGDDNETTTILD